jgi:hypothetical protein
MEYWKEDIGIDELNDDLFQQIIYDSTTGKHICHVFGNTLEELADNVERILETNFI